ncbi:MAG TPA: hypothetical protein PKA83_05230 [Pirellulaceae bacterium]|nr:hypothetical protein [Pirellulaceae bacterium]
MDRFSGRSGWLPMGLILFNLMLGNLCFSQMPTGLPPAIPDWSNRPLDNGQRVVDSEEPRKLGFPQDLTQERTVDQEWRPPTNEPPMPIQNNGLRGSRLTNQDGSERAERNDRFSNEQQFGDGLSDRDFSDRERFDNHVPDDFHQPIIDSQVHPVNFLSEQQPSLGVAEGILQSFDINLIQDALPGDPKRLVDVLAHTHPQHRLAAVNAYWTTYCDYVKTRLSAMEVESLGQLRTPANQTDQMVLRTAIANAENRWMQAEINFEKSANELARFLPPNQHGLLPLPADMPLLGEYRTNFAHYEARGQLPPRLRMIHELLPKQHSLLHSHAQACQMGRQSASQAIRAFNQGETSVVSAIEAIRLNREAHFGLVNSVASYNQSTNEYANAVAPLGQPAQQFVSMLIRQNHNQLDELSGLRQARNFEGMSPALDMHPPVNPPASNNGSRTVDPRFTPSNQGNQFGDTIHDSRTGNSGVYTPSPIPSTSFGNQQLPRVEQSSLQNNQTGFGPPTNSPPVPGGQGPQSLGNSGSGGSFRQ